MRIESLLIENFRGIKRVYLQKIGKTVVIAGQNGSGKSCVFDAIRLLKSVYGGYQYNEWQSWLGEFQIGAHNRLDGLRQMFRDPSAEITIEAGFSLHDSEKAYINSNAALMLTDSIWRQLLPEAFQYESAYRMALFSQQFRDREPEVQQRVLSLLPKLKSELANPIHVGRMTVLPGSSTLTTEDSPLLTAIFSTYRPKDLGVIDYHGAQRFYAREQVQNVNISLEQSTQVASQNSLYNSANKYANVKSELATSYIKEALSEKAGGNYASTAGLTETLQELFKTFFPDKKFLGPTPTGQGNLLFPVEARDGSKHDLDDLSAGEKEILYGYLRIRNSAPRHSIVLLDEPELHLNPRLVRSLPSFYRRNIGEALQNQMWLVTHSDAILRESVGKPDFDVYHMQPAGLPNDAEEAVSGGINQLKAIEVKKDVDVVITELVGDLAAYRPGQKGVIFEGGGSSDFDQKMTASLFPDFAERVNLVSGTNKSKVKALHEVLDRAYDRGDLPIKFYAIVDMDYSLDHEKDAVVTRFQWDVYHIENYLLHPEAIAYLISSFGTNIVTADQVLENLREAARGSVTGRLKHSLTTYASRLLTRSIDLSFNPAAEDLSGELADAVERSIKRISSTHLAELDSTKLREFEENERSLIEKSFADGSWMQTMPGRDILHEYVKTLPNGISYDVFKNMILRRLVDIGHQPPGMQTILEKILTD